VKHETVCRSLLYIQTIIKEKMHIQCTVYCIIAMIDEITETCDSLYTHGRNHWGSGVSGPPSGYKLTIATRVHLIGLPYLAFIINS